MSCVCVCNDVCVQEHAGLISAGHWRRRRRRWWFYSCILFVSKFFLQLISLLDQTVCGLWTTAPFWSVCCSGEESKEFTERKQIRRSILWRNVLEKPELIPLLSFWHQTLYRWQIFKASLGLQWVICCVCGYPKATATFADIYFSPRSQTIKAGPGLFRTLRHTPARRKQHDLSAISCCVSCLIRMLF